MTDRYPTAAEAAATERRQRWMAVLATARTDELEAHVHAHGNLPEFSWLRPPEFGAVMVQGRAGGTGARFNLGEMTVTRCALRLGRDGPVGHAYVQGRCARHAELAALFDALLQQEGSGPELERRVIDPLADAHARRKADRSRRANSTKVDFFTLVRGENPA